MEQFIAYMRDFNIVSATVRILLSLIAGGAIGMQREINGHAAGLRTHILVCLGASMTVMTGVFATQTLGYTGDPLRIAAQVVSGIGFIGAGTILVTQRLHIKGLTTAAGLWSTAAIGLACGIGFYEGAIICTVVILIVIVQFKNLDRMISGHSRKHRIYFEVLPDGRINDVIEGIAQAGVILSGVEIKPPKSGLPGNIGVEAAVDGVKDTDTDRICRAVLTVNDVSFAIEAD